MISLIMLLVNSFYAFAPFNWPPPISRSIVCDICDNLLYIFYIFLEFSPTIYVAHTNEPLIFEVKIDFWVWVEIQSFAA